MRFEQRLARAVRTLACDPRALAIVVVGVVACVYNWPHALSWWWFVAALFPMLWRWPGRVLWLVAVAAACWATWSIHAHQARLWPTGHTGEIHRVVGYVVGLPEKLPWRTRFRLAGNNGRTMRLSWYQDAPDLKPGDCVDVRAKLKTPHGSANPGLFDYEAWSWRKNIAATGYIKHAFGCDDGAVWTVDRLRARLKDKLIATLGDGPATGLIEALALGARSDITDTQWRVLRRTGTTHLVAISGLHIGLIAGWLYFITRWLVLRLRPGRWAEWAAVATAVAGASGYAALSGFALPTERALVMVAAAMLGALALRSVERSRLLALAAIIVVILWPAAILAPGFWLSFGAVAWLLYLIRPAAGSRWRQALFVQVGVVAGLMPFTLWFFGQASLIAPLVNAVLIPAAAIFVPAVLIACATAWVVPSLGAAILHVVAWVLAQGWVALAWIAGLPGMSTHLAVPGLAALVLALVGLIWLFAPRGMPARWLGVVLLGPTVLGWQPADQRVAPGHFMLSVLDVGQGAANVVRTARHTLIFDAGPAYRSGFNAGQAIVVPYLRYLGINRVDALALSHGDRDHSGGAAAIRTALDVRKRRGAQSQHPCRAGQHWRWDGVTFRFVYPNAREAELAGSDNARSCVLRITSNGGRHVLLTGDLAASQERALIRREPNIIADVLVVAHHGSATSSSDAFLNAVDPRYALISAGWHNRWGFPASVVLHRLRARNVQIANTATAGAITVNVGEHVDVSRWRAVHRRLWQRPRWPVSYNSSH
ncbi:DNA internalization-related competence protein ComEC/Rec2 [Salinisphaera sp. USBA-960]|uniref:DNA internalization-related competence protein ComEC/Rec2 n=1 Tax=Salinisphaera orenii TaxID=856731 RepID=UPI000DBE51D2|nr:DNA internalization-related competence protein ComEC/Rec2 [Salifodinibacter halophilus]NNC25898.1 DNA internalization-related competence protein ComEC/Rec2 [Salifodinibacter halophilus]